MLYEDKNKNESLFHAALIYSNRFRADKEASNELLKEKLKEYGSFESIFKSLFNIQEQDILKRIPSLENVVEKLNAVEFDFKLLTVKDIDFPNQLSSNPGAPPAIYVRGDISLFNNKNIAVVGTRHIYPNKDFQAYKEADNTIRRLVKNGYTLVSGLAEGCDTIAHEKAIELGGKTIAVLGTPLNQSYPAQNKELQEKIAKKHLLVSQYPIGIKTFGSYFAHRNLTTVSLAKEGIVVIKASDNSGTVYSIEYCARQRKPIYVLNNNFNEKNKWLEAYKPFIKRVGIKPEK